MVFQEKNLFKCLNYVEPNIAFKEAFNKLLSDINITELIEDDNE